MNNALNPIHYNLASLLSQIYSPTVLAQAQAIDPTVALPYATYSLGTIAQMLPPFPNISGIGDTYDNIDNSTYNSAQVVFRERMSNGLNFLFNYSFSAEMTITAPTATAISRSRSSVAAASLTSRASLTRPRSISFPSEKAIPGQPQCPGARTHGGWQVSGIYTYNSGIPLAIVPDFAQHPRRALHAQLQHLVRRSGSHQRKLWTRPDGHAPGELSGPAGVHSTPAILHLRQRARTAPDHLRGPTSYDIDMSLKKNIKMTERLECGVRHLSLQRNQCHYLQSGPAANGQSRYFWPGQQSVERSRDIQLSFRINY